MSDLATLENQLADARAAFHTVMTTGGVVKVQDGDQAVTYNAQSADRLGRYIASLERQIARVRGDCVPGSTAYPEFR